MGLKNHWEQIYKVRPCEQLGWYTPHLQTSVNWVDELQLAANARLVDVGGGASTLVDDLLEQGYRSITVVDISERALSKAKQRLGKKAELAVWLAGDITAFTFPANTFELWHDRAVFHFLTTSDAQQRYLHNLTTALKPGGHVIIGTFAPEAPPRCSGLPVQRYSAELLQKTLGPKFQLQRERQDMHVTPGGVEQMYQYCHFSKVG